MIQHSQSCAFAAQRYAFVAALGLLGLAAGSSGCGDDDGSDSPRQESSPATGAPGSLVIVTERSGPDSSLHYLHVLPDWPSNGSLDYGSAFELGAAGVSNILGGSFYFYHAEKGEMERVNINADRRATHGDVISFTLHRIRGFEAEPIWVSPDLAFLLDEKTGQIVRWSPRNMTIGDAFPVNPAVLTRDGMKAQFQLGIASAGRLFTTASWRNWDTDAVHPATVLGVFDQNSPANGPTLVEDSRCVPSVAIGAFTYGDGYVYAVGDGAKGYDVLASKMKSTSPQCVVRMREDGTAFDPSFFVDLNAVTGSPAIYMAYPMADHKLLVSMWAPDVDVATVAKPGSASWFWDAPPYYDYAIVDLNAKTATKVQGIPRGSVRSQKSLTVDGKNYVEVFREDRGSSLYRVDPDGTVTQVLSNPAGGSVQYLGRL